MLNCFFPVLLGFMEMGKAVGLIIILWANLSFKQFVKAKMYKILWLEFFKHENLLYDSKLGQNNQL